mmetsp:Transcript_42215/g.135055  ORF Transcript_42215/g.135055 Transcript_42215/m.135055 type:complete len:194 (+) Transcript_42215:185-766(+)
MSDTMDPGNGYLTASAALEGREYMNSDGRSLTDLFDSFSLAGKGAFSRVLQARDVHTGDLVALKMVTSDNRSMMNVVKEAAMLQSDMLRHPFIVETREASVFVANDGRGICTVHEYMGSANLQDKICEGVPFEESHVQVAFHRLISAVAHLHSMGVLHGDVKPDNIMLKEGASLYTLGRPPILAPANALARSP